MFWLKKDNQLPKIKKFQTYNNKNKAQKLKISQKPKKTTCMRGRSSNWGKKKLGNV